MVDSCQQWFEAVYNGIEMVYSCQQWFEAVYNDLKWSTAAGNGLKQFKTGLVVYIGFQ